MVSVLNTVDTSHEDMIHDAQLDYYGTKLATCSSDCSIKVFDIRAGQQNLLATLKGHEGPVWQVSWSHPKFGSLLASCGYDRKVIIWKEVNGEWSKLHEFTQYESSVNCVAWAPHEYGLVLATASSDCSITVFSSSGDGNWDTRKTPNAHLIGVNAVSWAPAVAPGSLLDASTDGQLPAKRLVSGGGDNLVKIWREESSGEWLEEHRLEAHSDWVRDVAWAPSVGLGTACIASCSQDGRVLIWRRSEAGRWESKLLENFAEAVWHLSWSLCGSMLAVATGDNKVSLWKETADGKWNCISDAKKGQTQD